MAFDFKHAFVNVFYLFKDGEIITNLNSLFCAQLLLHGIYGFFLSCTNIIIHVFLFVLYNVNLKSSFEKRKFTPKRKIKAIDLVGFVLTRRVLKN